MKLRLPILGGSAVGGVFKLHLGKGRCATGARDYIHSVVNQLVMMDYMFALVVRGSNHISMLPKRQGN